ncbi:ABC transporter [Caminicella sporogenes]|nr:ABC transporter [Caminicella sporogenes]
MKIDNIYKSYKGLKVLENFTMHIEGKKIIAILGPSGCGKTTLLNILAGIIQPDKGKVIGLENKKISYLFQEPRLIKWKTVWENIDFILKDKMAMKEREKVITKYLKMVNLMEFRNYYPNKLSGGMKQRAAIARAFAYPSDVLLMDEPFKSLDFELKFKLIDCFIKLWEVDKRLVFFVTHDIHAALLLGHDIYVLSEKPTNVKLRMVNEIPHRERSLKNKYILELEKKIIDNFEEITHV